MRRLAQHTVRQCLCSCPSEGRSTGSVDAEAVVHLAPHQRLLHSQHVKVNEAFRVRKQLRSERQKLGPPRGALWETDSNAWARGGPQAADSSKVEAQLRAAQERAAAEAVQRRLTQLEPAALVATLREMVDMVADDGHRVHRTVRPGGERVLTELAARPMLGPPALSLGDLLDAYYCAAVRLRAPLPEKLEKATSLGLGRAGAMRSLSMQRLVYATSFRLRQAQRRNASWVNWIAERDNNPDLDAQAVLAELELRLDDLSTQDMVTLMFAIKGLLPATVVKRVSVRLMAALPDMSPSQANDTADGALQYAQLPEVQSLLQAIEGKACKDVLSTAVRHLTIYIERQASAQRVPPLELIRAVTSRMAEFDEKSIRRLVMALMRLRYCDHNLMKALEMQVAIVRDEMNVVTISRIFELFAQVNMPLDERLAKFLSDKFKAEVLMSERREMFDDVSVALFLANAAIMGHLNAVQCRAIVEAAQARGGMRKAQRSPWKCLEFLLAARLATRAAGAGTDVDPLPPSVRRWAVEGAQRHLEEFTRYDTHTHFGPLMRVCENELGLRDVVKLEMTHDAATWAEVAATAADGTRLAFVHTKVHQRLRGADGFARHADALGLLANVTARIRMLAQDGYRVIPIPLEEWFWDGVQAEGLLPSRAEYLRGLLALDDAALIARAGAPATGVFRPHSPTAAGEDAGPADT
ncbi:hypothetical protein WJX81_004905 [Elliptochloris bilobata]|uniref:RAP domain-containing protein n=1 Tax=Elliptochloris bilobata TaxID=381761 RepID=A0AAW1RV09_9CHLO